MYSRHLRMDKGQWSRSLEEKGGSPADKKGYAVVAHALEECVAVWLRPLEPRRARYSKVLCEESSRAPLLRQNLMTAARIVRMSGGDEEHGGTGG